MLEAKWSLDETNGRGFQINQQSGQTAMFTNVEADNFDRKVEDFIRQNSVTNNTLFEFGLKNGYLPKHTKVVLDSFKQKGILDIKALDGKPIQGYYLDNTGRNISIKLK